MTTASIWLASSRENILKYVLVKYSFNKIGKIRKSFTTEHFYYKHNDDTYLTNSFKLGSIFKYVFSTAFSNASFITFSMHYVVAAWELYIM